ncbi:rhodanese-like domain-containing protein [Streptococcus porci]|uniref:rhodanese-like domain-containing protein n=1 Tax=Streptococcus porci TaxID=502567 RepID=UPI0003F7AB49|nr:rhodanese-like domain-containing protein [Streptococcus porci]
MFRFLKKLFSQKIESITTKELEHLLKDKKIRLLDVRSQQEYHRGHIKEARNLPLNRLKSYQAPKSNPVYIICQSGMRSKRAANILSQKGYQVVNVSGGMSAYTRKIIGGK